MVFGPRSSLKECGLLDQVKLWHWQTLLSNNNGKPYQYLEYQAQCIKIRSEKIYCEIFEPTLKVFVKI